MTEKNSAEDKHRALELALTQIEKSHGKGAIMRLGGEDIAELPVIPSGSISLDMAMVIGGYPRGRIVEIFGPEMSGKTTLALHAIANAQAKDGVGALVDAENAFDPHYARKIGVNLDELLISQPDTGEQALDIVETLVRSNAVDIVVIDSVAALVPRAEIEGEMGDSYMGLQARLMSQAMRKLTTAINRSKTCVIFLNQIREKIGVMFGSSEFTPGGRALKFYSSIRIDLRRIATLKDGDRSIGSRLRARVVKNKLAPPFREAELDIIFGEGISYAGEIIDLGVKLKIIDKSGAWLSYGGQRLGQGRENARQFLKENPDILSEIESKIREQLKKNNK
ncbi:recombinase RecA [Candidatus Sumerlaeota bacterium]|nr:recombinase RecA [Candidatus Sumerlaeota bacterium]